MARSKKRLQELLTRLNSGDDIAIRDMKNTLNQQEFEQYEHEWQWIKDLKNGIGIDTCSEYERIIHDADFTYNKAESGRFNKKVSNRLHELAQSQYENGLEVLREAIGMNPNLIAAYDRFPDSFSAGISLSPAGVPRSINSKSIHNKSDITKMTKRELKIRVVRRSLDEFDSEVKREDKRIDGKDGKEGKDGKDGKESEEGVKFPQKFDMNNESKKLKRLLFDIKK